jgi:hypothetical protein
MPLLSEKRNRTLYLTLSRPHARNCWAEDYNEGLLAELGKAIDDDEIRCVVLTGDESGGAFSAGADLKNPKAHSTTSAAAFIKRVGKARNFPANCGSHDEGIAEPGHGHSEYLRCRSRRFLPLHGARADPGQGGSPCRMAGAQKAEFSG